MPRRRTELKPKSPYKGFRFLEVDMDIVVAADNETMEFLKTCPEFKGMDFFVISDGPGKFQGRRITNAHVDRYCCSDPHYLGCLDTIVSSIALTSEHGKMYLI
jgi:hypothetical protein